MQVMMASNNTTQSDTQSVLSELNGFYYARLVCYVIIFIVGVIGNVLVCLVVCRQRKMKNVTNYFIVNLAVADLAVLLICIPFDFGEIVTNYWPYGAVMCKLIYPLQTLATTASVGTLVAISLNRFFAIIYPLRPQLTTCDAKKVIFVVWLLSIALVSPYIAVLQHKDETCYETFNDQGMNPGLYTLSIFIVQYVLPLTLIGLSYIRIGRDLRRDKGSYSNDALQREQDKEAHKVVKILTIVVIVFAFLMLPNHIVFIWIDFGGGGKHKYISDIMSLGQILVYFNSGTNPLIYNAVNEQFREGFRQYFQSWKEMIFKVTGRQPNTAHTDPNVRSNCLICSASDNDSGEELKNNNNTRCVETITTTEDVSTGLLTKV